MPGSNTSSLDAENGSIYWMSDFEFLQTALIQSTMALQAEYQSDRPKETPAISGDSAYVFANHPHSFVDAEEHTAIFQLPSTDGLEGLDHHVLTVPGLYETELEIDKPEVHSAGLQLDEGNNDNVYGSNSTRPPGEADATTSRGTGGQDNMFRGFPHVDLSPMARRWAREESLEERLLSGLPTTIDPRLEVEYRPSSNSISKADHGSTGIGGALTWEAIAQDDARRKELEMETQQPAVLGYVGERVSGDSKGTQLNDYIPSEEDAIRAFPGRVRVPGENAPYELATGRQTTAPRRTRRPRNEPQLVSENGHVASIFNGVDTLEEENPQRENEVSGTQLQNRERSDPRPSRGSSDGDHRHPTGYGLAPPSEQQGLYWHPSQQLDSQFFNQQALASPSSTPWPSIQDGTYQTIEYEQHSALPHSTGFWLPTDEFIMTEQWSQDRALDFEALFPSIVDPISLPQEVLASFNTTSGHLASIVLKPRREAHEAKLKDPFDEFVEYEPRDYERLDDIDSLD